MDGGGVMTEIIDHGDTVLFPAHFHAALDASEGGLNLGVRDAAMAGAGGGRQGVADVQFPRET